MSCISILDWKKDTKKIMVVMQAYDKSLPDRMGIIRRAFDD